MYYSIGIDLGDKTNFVCVLNEDKSFKEEFSLPNDKASLKKLISKYPNCEVALESCSHSLWISEFLYCFGVEVYIANPRKLKSISESYNKSDKKDAEILARLLRFDKELLHPISHRSIYSQIHLEFIKGRRSLVKSRTALISHVRGVVKSLGGRIPTTITADYFHKKAEVYIEKDVRPVVAGVLRAIKHLTAEIIKYDKKIYKLVQKEYPEVEILQTIPGIGPITALCFVLVIGDPSRFKKSRDVGAYLGLVPRRDQSGDLDKQLRITKAGNGVLRALLVNCSNYIMGAFGPDTQIRRHGERIRGRGGSNIRKKKACIGVARKLSVIMHRMMVTGEEFKNLIIKEEVA